jgi:hypothetical protein
MMCSTPTEATMPNQNQQPTKEEKVTGQTPRFTPGPWVVDGDGSEEERGGAFAIRMAAHGRLGIASIWHESGGDPKGSPTAEANARLVAAAPDLFEALRHLSGLFASLHPNHAEWGDYQAALAALTKAGGK